MVDPDSGAVRKLCRLLPYRQLRQSSISKQIDFIVRLALRASKGTNKQHDLVLIFILRRHDGNLSTRYSVFGATMTTTVTRTVWALLWVLDAVQRIQGQVSTCTSETAGEEVRRAREV